MHKAIINNVYLAPKAEGRDGNCRRGTVYMSLSGFAAKFGDPHEADYSEEGIDGYGKVTAIWHIHTPRGAVHVRDYWWNPPDELSIGASNAKSTLWLRAWLRKHGVKCE